MLVISSEPGEKILASSDGFKIKRINDAIVNPKRTAFLSKRYELMDCSCGLLWCFYQLLGLIHCRGSIGEQGM